MLRLGNISLRYCDLMLRLGNISLRYCERLSCANIILCLCGTIPKDF
jgi:hypothetical protein